MYDWKTLARHLSLEDALLGTRLSGDDLAQAHREGHMAVIACGTRVIACGALWPTPAPGWRELGTMWVHPDERGQGLSSRVFGDLTASCRTPVFLITHNPRVAHLATRHGWSCATEDTWNRVPTCAACGLCDRVAPAQQPGCRMRATPSCQLWFFAA